MDDHKNAALTPKGRDAMVRSVVEGGLKGRSHPPVQCHGEDGRQVDQALRRGRCRRLRDRSLRPLSSPRQTLLATCTAVQALRRRRYIGEQIAAELGISPAAVSRILRRLGLNRSRDMEPGRAGTAL